MGLIYEMIKRKKELAAKNTPPPPTNPIQDVVWVTLGTILEGGNTLNLDCPLLETHIKKSHYRMGEMVMDSSKPADVDSTKR